MSDEKTVFLFSCTHHSASLELREKLAFSSENIDACYAFFMENKAVDEMLVLSTCNRLEFYFYGNNGTIEELFYSYIGKMKSVEERILKESFVLLEGIPLIEHLFSVCAGINSQMIGETDILGQVKDAYAYALEKKATGTYLNIIFQKGFHEAKWARSHTKIASGQVSIGNIAVELATRIFGELNACKVLIVGSGDVGEKTAQAFVHRGAEDITVSSRRFCSAIALSDRFHAAILDFSTFREKLKFFDIVVCSTSAPSFILDYDAVKEAMKARSSRALFLIDLAVPRDVEPEAERIDNVFLYNLDDIAAVANENLSVRQAAVDDCKAAFGQKARALWSRILAR